jgi:transposase-like protein
MASVRCPYCGETIDVWVEPGSVAHQRYVEDCSVCCRPIELTIAAPDGDDDYFVSAEREGG